MYKKIIISARQSSWYTDLMSKWETIIFPHGIQHANDSEVVKGESKQTSFTARRSAHNNEVANILKQMQIMEPSTHENCSSPSNDGLSSSMLSYLTDNDDKYSQATELILSECDD
jgi:hypothetical protein